VTYIIAEPCIDIKDRSCVDVCPVEAIFPEDALPEKWEPFIKINYAYQEGFDVVNKLTDEYATEHNVKNEPIA
jgi:Fe-S-cluster-containing hydrogenase component 2